MEYVWEKLVILSEAEVAQGRHGIAPILLDLDPCLEIDLRAHEVLDILAGKLAYLLEHRALFADDNALMAVLFAVYRHFKIDYAILAFGELRDLDSRAVRYLLIKSLEQLFAHELRAYLALRLVGYHIVREICRTFRQILGDLIY